MHQLRVTWQHIRRSPYQAAAAIMIMTLTMFVGLGFFLISLGSDKVLTYLEQRPRVIVFFNDSVKSKSDVAGLVNQIEKTGKANSIKFVSKDEALQIYKDRNKGDPLLLEYVTSGMLPSSLEVSAKDVSDIPALFNILKKAPNNEGTSYQKDVVNALIQALDQVRKFGLVLVSFLIITSLFTIITIIGMKISLRKDEIEISRLIGASKWYIRAPFLLEGIFYGVFGALISWAVVIGIIFALTPQLMPYFSGMHILPLAPIFIAEILGGVAFIGAVVGGFGSFLAVWRYLKN